MEPNVGIFLLCTGAFAFLQVSYANTDKPCVFPFTYWGKTYFDCTVDGSLYHWCSQEASYAGKWKYCKTDDRAPCFFPFKYLDKMYRRCTTNGSFIQKQWCSLTADFDKDGAWKNCYV